MCRQYAYMYCMVLPHRIFFSHTKWTMIKFSKIWKYCSSQQITWLHNMTIPRDHKIWPHRMPKTTQCDLTTWPHSVTTPHGHTMWQHHMTTQINKAKWPHNVTTPHWLHCYQTCGVFPAPGPGVADSSCPVSESISGANTWIFRRIFREKKNIVYGLGLNLGPSAHQSATLPLRHHYLLWVRNFLKKY